MSYVVLWATRETEEIDKVRNPDKYTKITLRELIIYGVYLAVLCIGITFLQYMLVI